MNRNSPEFKEGLRKTADFYYTECRQDHINRVMKMMQPEAKALIDLLVTQRGYTIAGVVREGKGKYCLGIDLVNTSGVTVTVLDDSHDRLLMVEQSKMGEINGEENSN